MPLPHRVLSRRAALSAAAGLTVPALAGRARAQAKSVITLTRQPSIIYMPTFLMEARKLVERHAAALGVADLKTNWVTFSGGGNATDAMLAGSVDFVNTGPGNLLLLWDRTRGGVKGVVATCSQPLTLITRNPAVKTIRDFTDKDRIAVPTVRVSTQAVVLQIECAKVFGADQWNKLDANTVQLGHPDAFAALMNPGHEIQSHFSAPPFAQEEVARVPGGRAILTSNDVMGSPLNVTIMFTPTRFADANPKVVQAVRLASAEAVDAIRNDTAASIATYKEISGDRMPAAQLLDIMHQPNMLDYTTDPQGTMRFAEHLHRIGTLKTRPASWQDYFLPSAHDLHGS